MFALATAIKKHFQVESTLPDTKPETMQQAFLQVLLKTTEVNYSPFKGRGGTEIKSPFGTHTKVTKVREGLQVTIGGHVNFPSESAELQEEVRSMLDDLAEKLRGSRNKIEVRGHDDSIPIPAGPWKDDAPHKWRIGFERALKVAEYLVESGGILPERIRIASAGKYEPSRDNVFERDGRAENRRVEVVITEEHFIPRGGKYEVQ